MPGMDAETPKPIKFLPSYVGSKACWVGKLGRYGGRDFVEFFAGSAVLSANHKILLTCSNFV